MDPYYFIWKHVIPVMRSPFGRNVDSTKRFRARMSKSRLLEAELGACLQVPAP